MRHLGLSRVADVIMAPIVYPSAWVLRVIRERGVQNFPRCKEALLAMGVFPIRDHYTEPQFSLRTVPAVERKLGGIAWNLPEQLALLGLMSYASELAARGSEGLRTKVEDVGLPLFDELEPNDVLFIDSSHVIRPGGDVLFEYLELLPRLRPGVIVHVHDIFSPRDYPQQWLVDWVR